MIAIVIVIYLIMGTTVACTGPTKHQNSEYCNSEHLGSARNNAGYFVWNNNMYCNIFFRPLHIMKTHFGMTCSLTSLPISSRNRMRKHGNTNSSSVVSGDSLLLFLRWSCSLVHGLHLCRNWDFTCYSFDVRGRIAHFQTVYVSASAVSAYTWQTYDMIFKSVTSYK